MSGLEAVIFLTFGTIRVCKHVKVLGWGLCVACRDFATVFDGSAKAGVAHKTSCGEPHAGNVDEKCRIGASRNGSMLL